MHIRRNWKHDDAGISWEEKDLGIGENRRFAVELLDGLGDRAGHMPECPPTSRLVPHHRSMRHRLQKTWLISSTSVKPFGRRLQGQFHEDGVYLAH